MKFKEFLKEDQTERDLGDWVMDYVTYIDGDHSDDRDDNSYTYDFKNGEFWLLNKNGDAAHSIVINFTDHEFEAPPLGKYKWPQLQKIEIVKSDISKWTDVPPSAELSLQSSNLPSLKGITALKDLEALNFIEVDNILFESKGLLGILKLPKLKSFKWSPAHNSYGFKKLHKALNIIQEHVLGDKNIVEAQSEIIDAGLDEYAKL